MLRKFAISPKARSPCRRRTHADITSSRRSRSRGSRRRRSAKGSSTSSIRRPGGPRRPHQMRPAWLEEPHTQDVDDGRWTGSWRPFFDRREPRGQRLRPLSRRSLEPLRRGPPDDRLLPRRVPVSANAYRPRTLGPDAGGDDGRDDGLAVRQRRTLQEATPRAFRRGHERRRNRGAPLTTLETLKSGGLGYDKPKLAALHMMMAVADAVARSIASLTWILVEATEGEFVTSDRALAMHDPTPKFPWAGHGLHRRPGGAHRRAPARSRRPRVPRSPCAGPLRAAAGRASRGRTPPGGSCRAWRARG